MKQDSKLTHAIKNVIVANRNLGVLKDNLQDDLKDTNASVFDQIGSENLDIKYLDLFIQLTEQCINNPNKSATLCTDLILKISFVISDPSKWPKHFNSMIQFQRNQIREKINQFLSNCILLVENQKPVQKIIIMALTNLVVINEPEDETLCELCLKTLKTLYKNNPEIKQLLKKTIQKNILANLEQQHFSQIPICLLKGLIELAGEVKLGDWMTDKQCILFGRWLEQIFKIFKDKDKKTVDISIEYTLQLMSRCFIAESFSIQLEEFITMDGIMDIITYCFHYTKKNKPEEVIQKNKIVVYLFEMTSSVNRFLKKAYPEIKQDYYQKVTTEIQKMIDELEQKKYNFAISDSVNNQEQCQIINKKLGCLIRAYATILVDNPKFVDLQTDAELENPIKKKERELFGDDKKEEKNVFLLVIRLLIIKNLDPYIYGSLCQFLVVLLNTEICELYITSIAQNIDNFTHILLVLSRNFYFGFLQMAKVYGKVIIPTEYSLSYIPTQELQYAIAQILQVFVTIQKKALDPNDTKKFKEKLKLLEPLNYKNIILACLDSSIENIRTLASYLLSNISSKKWEFEDLKQMLKILENLQTLLQDSQGEEEISCLLMIFCNLVASIDNPVSIQFRGSTISKNLSVVAYKILKTNMGRDTKGDESQTKQKLELSASCVFLLTQYLYSQDLRVNLFNQKALIQIGDALRLEDIFVTDVSSPLAVESVCLVIQPLFQAIESDNAINITHLNFFRVLMQISSILNFQMYHTSQQETLIRYEETVKFQAQKEQNHHHHQQQKFDKKLNDSLEELNQTSEQILSEYKKNLYMQCKEQWNVWKLIKFQDYQDLKLIDDLLSAFEVQHTIFSSQNGVDRLLICLQPLIQFVKLDLEERTINLDTLYQQEAIEYQAKVVTSTFSKHAIVTKLVGLQQNPEIATQRYLSQFFEVIQQKKILANVMVDITTFSEEQFFEYMSTIASNKTKIALITSAFLYTCYVSIIFAPSPSILLNALIEIQQKDKLIGYIKLCAASDWYNANVSIKLFKIYRLIGQYMVYSFNLENQYKFLKFVQEENIKQIRSNGELPAEQDKKLTVIKQIIKKIDQECEQKKKNLFSGPNEPKDYLETCYLINKTIYIILSDFKEIIQSLNEKQLTSQLKLINSICKTYQMVYKQQLICVTQIQQDEYHLIFSVIRKMYKLIGVDNFFDELTSCMQKLDRKLSQIQKIDEKNQKQLYKLYKNISSILGILFIQKGEKLKELFKFLCQRFDSNKLSESVNSGIKNWMAQLVLLHQFTYKDVQNQFSNQIPVYETLIDFKKIESYSKTKNCILLIFNTYFIIVEIIDVIISQEFLFNNISNKNYKIHLHVQNSQIKECFCLIEQHLQEIAKSQENNDSDQRIETLENNEEIEEGLRTLTIQLMNLEASSKKDKIDYEFYFTTKWECSKYVKLLTTLSQSTPENPFL